MPVYLEGDHTRHDLGARTKFGLSEFQGSLADCLHIGLINNMPDAALVATERQFLTLLDSAANGVAVRLSLYALPEVPRSESGRRHISSYYSSVDDLWESQLDGLIVTGTEPRASNLADEPYWKTFTRVIDWAEQNTYSSVWSCLAAHAALFHLDGISRRRLSDKRFGVFECSRASDHELTAGTPSFLPVPHSRWNDIPENELAACGYRILTKAKDGGVDAFVKQRKSLFVFFQGHPEYEAKTLLLEYRRDVGRYLRGERDTYPEMPHGDYFDEDTSNALEAVRGRAMSHRCEEVLADFPIALAETRIANTWSSAGACVYGNWLTYLYAQKERLKEELSRTTILPPIEVGPALGLASAEMQ
jgi:homoserine O-succinyltransferase